MEEAGSIIERLNLLVEELENYPDTEVREKTLDLVQMILALHGEVLRRILKTLDRFSQKEQILPQLLADEVIRSALIIHDLMPEDLPTRVAGAVETMRPFLVAQGCDIKLLGIEDGRARMRLMRNGQGAPPLSVLKSEIEKALAEAAPDLSGIVIDGMEEQMEAAAQAAKFLGSLLPGQQNGASAQKPVQIKRKPLEKSADAKWISVIRAPGFDEGRLETIGFADLNVLVCKTGGEFYAFRNACAETGGKPFDNAAFENPLLVCACHGYHYDLRRRGASVEKPEIKLEPLPLKIEDDKIKVAL